MVDNYRVNREDRVAMVISISILDDSEREFIYRRDVDDPFKWRLTTMGGRPSNVPADGHIVLWEIATAVRQGIET